MIFEQLDYWHWWIFGIALIILEVFAPGAFFLWLGVSAGIVGFVLVLVPSLNWQFQFLIFGILAVTSIVLWRLRLNKHPMVSDRPNLNRRGEQYVGRVFTLHDSINDGIGKIRVDDSTWRVQGQDREKGKKIVVVGVDGATLLVEPKD